MADTRMSSAAVYSPSAALEAIGVVDLSDPGPSSQPLHAHHGGHAAHYGSHSHNAQTHGGDAHSATANALGLPPDAQVVRVPEGERYRVRAVYDFEATDESALSFRAGDIIEVLTMLPSGWWDGMLATSRGWFPSNYVEDVEDGELDDADEFDNVHDETLQQLQQHSLQQQQQHRQSRYSTAASIEIIPDNRVHNGSSGDLLGFEDSMTRAGWGSWPVDVRSTSLDDLALELMGGDPGVTSVQHGAKRDPDNLTGAHDPDETLRSHLVRRSVGPGGNGNNTADDAQGDAWVPNITPDGRVYYHNTHTGENAWEIPDDEEDVDYGTAGQNGDEPTSSSHYGQPRATDSYDPAEERRRRPSTSTTSSARSRPASMQPDEQFRVPPHRVAGGVPLPWTARLSDDGRTWYYVNQETGETRRTPPQAVATEAASSPTTATDAAARRISAPPASISGTVASSANRAPSIHASVHTGRSQQDWEDRIRTQLSPLFATPGRPNIQTLVSVVVDAIQLVYEAAIAGAAAEEQILLAREAESDLSTALRYDDDAVERAALAQIAVVTAVRSLVIALGYVGPLIPAMRSYDPSAQDDIMSRPAWTSDMSLVGSLGLLQITIHGAITGPRGREASESAWTMVIRAAKKLRSVVESFPDLALSDSAPDRRDVARARRLAAWFGADRLGDFMSGRFGFGNVKDTVLRPLDQAAVVEVQKLKAECDAVIRTGGGGWFDSGSLEIVRSTARFRDAVGHIDVAIAIDLDGDLTESSPSDDDARAYADLVSKARHALRDLDEANMGLYTSAADVFLRAGEPQALSTREKTGHTVASVFRALSALLVVAQQQVAMLDHGQVRGSLGARSPAVAARRVAAAAAEIHGRALSVMSFDLPISERDPTGNHERQPSLASTESGRNRAATTESEYLDQDEARRARRGSRVSRASHSASASGSQTSLVASIRRGEGSSSSTSLAYAQDVSDTGGSMRNSNRASILKAVPSFLRNRSGSEDQAKKSGKKLAKLLGEESVATATRTGAISSVVGGTVGSMMPPSSAISPSIASSASIAHQPPPPAPMAPPPSAMRSQDAWYLATDFPVGELVFDDRGAVKAGTIRGLVARLTAHVQYDNAFFQAFLLTFRSFVNIDELVELLIERYNITAPPDLTPDQIKEWTLRKQTPVRLRVANALKAWLDNYYVESEDIDALGVVDEFAKTTLVANGNELISRQLTQLVDRRRRGDGDAQSRRVITGGQQPPPQPILPRQTSRPIALLDIQPLELARQLTLIESTCFQRIRPSECLNKQWNMPVNDRMPDLAPNVRRAILVGDSVARWATWCIVSTKEMKMRMVILKHFIRVAYDLRELHNFSSMAGVVAAISGSAVMRMKRTWDLVPDKSMKEWRELERTMDSSKNFSKYREMLKTVNPPCVPFLGLYLSALTFIEDGNKDKVPGPNPDGSQPMTPSASSMSMRKDSISTIATSNSAATATTMISTTATIATTINGSTTTGGSGPMLINFFKRQLSADIIREIQQYQSQPYNLATCKPIQVFIESGIDSVSQESEELYQLSLANEPKEDPNRSLGGVSGGRGGQW